MIQIESEEARVLVQDGADRQPVSWSLELEASSHLFLSLAGKPRAVVTEEVQRLSLAELSTIWTVSASTAAHCASVIEHTWLLRSCMLVE